MTGSGPVGVGLIGAGVISEQYLGNLTAFPDLDVRFIADIDVARAAERAAQFGVPASGTVDELLADEGIEIVVNLTLPAVHTEVDLRVIAAGKHVWSEKPIATNAADARAALDAAAAAGVRLAVAPDTLLGAGLQTAFRAIADGRIGTPRSATTMVLNPGPDRWHPAPEFLFQRGAGPLFDMGPYYLSALVAVLGPVERVAGVGSIARSPRTVGSGPRAGAEFDVEVPTHVALLLAFAGGASAQATFSFESALLRDGFFEVTGTDGAIVLPDPNTFDGDSVLWTRAAWAPIVGHDVPEPEHLPAVGATATSTRGIGVLDLARSIRAGVPERASGGWVPVTSTAVVAAPLPADWDPYVRTLA